jgi:hypothetical protein
MDKKIQKKKNGFMGIGKLFSLFFYFILVIVVAGLFMAALVYRDQLIKFVPPGIIQKFLKSVTAKPFPELSGPKTMVFEWKYKNKNYSFEETLYKSAYEFYQKEPKKYTCYGAICPANWEGEYFKMFSRVVENDNTMKEVADKLKTIGQKAKFSDDEIAELALAFVQAIPYDEAKAKSPDLLPRYPYEVLYDNKGICSDKSFLIVSLMRELGYGVALFNYDSAQHIAPAIKCPQNYSSYDSGFCYAETTNTGFKIGEIPTIDASNNLAVVRAPIGTGGVSQSRTVLSDAKIYQVLEGKTYQGIIATSATIKKINDLEKQIVGLSKSIEPYKIQVNVLAKEANSYKDQAEAAYQKYQRTENQSDYNDYTNAYSQFTIKYKEYNAAVAEYNKQVENYNNIVYQYNSLIKSFYSQ